MDMGSHIKQGNSFSPATLVAYKVIKQLSQPGGISISDSLSLGQTVPVLAALLLLHTHTHTDYFVMLPCCYKLFPKKGNGNKNYCPKTNRQEGEREKALPKG